LRLGVEVSRALAVEQGQVAKLVDSELEPDNDRNRVYYETELDKNPNNNAFVYSTLNQSFHRRLTKDLE
jgi:hypothetical protein